MTNTIDPFHPSSAYARSKDVASRSRQEDLRELMVDKTALEDQYIHDKQERDQLQAELERITQMLAEQTKRVTHTQQRLQNRIREIATLELQETDNAH